MLLAKWGLVGVWSDHSVSKGRPWDLKGAAAAAVLSMAGSAFGLVRVPGVKVLVRAGMCLRADPWWLPDSICSWDWIAPLNFNLSSILKGQGGSALDQAWEGQAFKLVLEKQDVSAWSEGGGLGWLTVSCGLLTPYFQHHYLSLISISSKKETKIYWGLILTGPILLCWPSLCSPPYVNQMVSSSASILQKAGWMPQGWPSSSSGARERPTGGVQEEGRGGVWGQAGMWGCGWRSGLEGYGC